MKFTIFDGDFLPCGINVVFTSDRFNAAYFEHAYLVEQTGSVLCQPKIFLWKTKK